MGAYFQYVPSIRAELSGHLNGDEYLVSRTETLAARFLIAVDTAPPLKERAAAGRLLDNAASAVDAVLRHDVASTAVKSDDRIIKLVRDILNEGAARFGRPRRGRPSKRGTPEYMFLMGLAVLWSSVHDALPSLSWDPYEDKRTSPFSRFANAAHPIPHKTFGRVVLERIASDYRGLFRDICPSGPRPDITSPVNQRI
ncbi:MAG TPA: hypothetical protein ENJ79_02620 [Gammaproteobacteria bacterium]|nr:hypothetical protein [Gammaproteobacteria bacterium]